MSVLSAIVGFIVAALGTPLFVFLFGPAVRGKPSWSVVGRAVPPTLRSREPWVRVGELSQLPKDAPTLVTVRVPVEDGWIKDDAPVAVYVLRTATDQAKIFDIHCTHMGCPVRWNPAARRFFSPCHGGVFDEDGRVLAGPPPRPLDQYATRIDAGVLYMGPLEPAGA